MQLATERNAKVKVPNYADDVMTAAGRKAWTRAQAQAVVDDVGESAERLTVHQAILGVLTNRTKSMFQFSPELARLLGGAPTMMLVALSPIWHAQAASRDASADASDSGREVSRHERADDKKP